VRFAYVLLFSLSTTSNYNYSLRLINVLRPSYDVVLGTQVALLVSEYECAVWSRVKNRTYFWCRPMLRSKVVSI